MAAKKKVRKSGGTKRMSKAAAAETPMPYTVKRFGTAAKSFADKATRSRALAKKALVRLGIHTPSGEISKRYK